MFFNGIPTTPRTISSKHILSTELEKRIAGHASIIDEDGMFPSIEFDLMKEEGLMAICLPGMQLDFDLDKTIDLLYVLKCVGRANLSVGRIYEGHINALELIHLFAGKEQKQQWYKLAKANNLFGVWNTQTEGGVTIELQKNGKYLLTGSKTYCSGGNWIDAPLITAEMISGDRRGWQMCIIPPGEKASIKTDKGFWKPLGMKASASFKMDLTGIEIEGKDLLGLPGDYYLQPFFSSGAIRFAAVQVGGAEAILKATHETLKTLGRSGDVFQKARIAEMSWLLESANLWIEKTGHNLTQWKGDVAAKEKMGAYVGMARSLVEENCIRIMRLSEQCIGSRALMRPHVLERLHRDLTVYLRQPGPDATLVGIGDYLLKQPCINEPWH